MSQSSQSVDEQAEIDEMFYWSDMKKAWLDQLPRYEEAQWLNIFPEAKKRYGRFTKGKLKIEKRYLIEAKEKVKHKAIEELRGNTDGEWRDQLIKERARSNTIRIEKRIRTIDALIELCSVSGSKKSKEHKVRITELMVQRAKEYPLEQLIEINRAGFTKCFSHNDSKPSAYCKKNFVHCFVCQRSWDTIAVLMERDGRTFRDAVLQLQ